MRKTKKRLKEKKFIKKKLFGGKLKEVIAPKKIRKTNSIYNFFFNLI
jgi:hypothetical protein